MRVSGDLRPHLAIAGKRLARPMKTNSDSQPHVLRLERGSQRAAAAPSPSQSPKPKSSCRLLWAEQGLKQIALLRLVVTILVQLLTLGLSF